MSRIYKINEPIVPTIDSQRDFYGVTGFKASYINKATGTVTRITSPFSEILKSVAGSTSNTSADVAVGAYIIPVVDGSQFSDGDVVSDSNGDIHHILSIDTNDLHVKQPFTQALASGEAITEVGNTGLYPVSFSIPTPGDYTIIMSNPSVNMQNIILPVTVKTETIDDVQAKLDTVIAELGATSSEVRFTAYL